MSSDSTELACEVARVFQAIYEVSNWFELDISSAIRKPSKQIPLLQKLMGSRIGPFHFLKPDLEKECIGRPTILTNDIFTFPP